MSTKICRLGSLFIFSANRVLCTVQFFHHYVQSPQITKISTRSSTQPKRPNTISTIHMSTQKDNNPLIILIHSTYTKLGHSPYKNPNPKWIRFVHFLLDLISTVPRSNHFSNSALVHFPTAPQQFVHFVTSFLGTTFSSFSGGALIPSKLLHFSQNWLVPIGLPH
jgi:hypothetical protein